MIIIKHGSLCDAEHNELKGVCKVCGCEFVTYIDVVKKDDENIMFITDPEATNIKFEPEYAYNDWIPDAPLKKQVLIGMNCSMPCPECKRSVELMHFKRR